MQVKRDRAGEDLERMRERQLEKTKSQQLLKLRLAGDGAGGLSHRWSNPVGYLGLNWQVMPWRWPNANLSMNAPGSNC